MTVHRAAWFVFACACAHACGSDERAPFVLYRSHDAGADGGVKAGDACARAESARCSASDEPPPETYPWRTVPDGGRGVDAGNACVGSEPAACAPAVTPPPPPVPAVFDAATLGKPVCTRFDEPAPRDVALFAAGGRLHVIDVDPVEPVPPLRIRSAATGLDFGAPVTLLYGARRADLIEEGSKLAMLVARQFYAVALSSDDGSTWIEGQHVGPDEPTYNCDGYPPLGFFRGRSPARFLAMGNDLHDGIFGCHSRVFLSRRGGDTWATPTQIGEGTVLFGFDGKERVFLLTSGGALLSDDGGKTFVKRAEVHGSGAAWTGRHLVVARGHDGAGGVEMLFSDDEGASWRTPVLLLAEPTYGVPFVAVDGATLGVAVALPDAIVVTRSADHGDTWSKPRRVARAPGEALVGVAVEGSRVAWLTTGDSYQVCATQ